ncbi:helicase associated domain-containing protein [Streptomyces sp. NPDC088674]|uniref:helicase associated domain-containing protein n=1 Tax=Streptomyces sp. NPDC088674 TaxID=3365869 RepID=UPI003813E736
MLLRFSTPRSASTIAVFLRTRVYQPESTVWLEGYEALRAWRAGRGVRGVCAVPYDAEVAAGASRRYPVGRWTAAQRRAHREGTLNTHRVELLDAEGMVWEPREEEWEHTLAGLRSYRTAYGHLAPRRRETWGEGADVVRVGDLVANLRRKGGFGRDEERAAARAAQLRAVDADWDCPWPLDWQRCCRQLVLLAADEPDGRAPRIAPGVRIDGDDLGAWVARQQEPRVWARLSAEQRARLEALGLRPTETAPGRAVQGTGAAGSGKRTAAAARAAFQRGVAALAQWVEREGAEKPVPRKHTETIVFDGEDVDVRLGVWVSNAKSRFDGLSVDERKQLAALGLRPAEMVPGRGVEGTGAEESGRQRAAARAAFQRGVAALAQWVEREGAERPVPRKHVETVVFDGEDVDVRLGVWTSNTRARFGTLGEDERAQLAALGVSWAG